MLCSAENVSDGREKYPEAQLPGSLLADEEFRVVDAEANLVATLAKVSVTQGCKSGQEE